MRRVLAVAALLLFPWSASAFLLSADKIACAPVGTTQTFGTDPFSAITWSAGPASGACIFRFDTDHIERDRDADSCDNTTAVARWQTDGGPQGCEIYQISHYDNGLVTSNAWRPGLIFNNQSGASAQIQAQNFVYCDNLTCGTLTYVKQDAAGPLTCSTFGDLAVGDWIAVCWGSGDATTKKVNAYNLGATNPGAPIRPGKPGDPYGTPVCQFTTCPNGACDHTGARGGIYSGGNTVGVDGFIGSDNYELHRCPENPT